MSGDDLASLDLAGPAQLCAETKRNAERHEKQFQSDRDKAWRSGVPVSYTHLTLPTILLV
eukprot:924082-Pyramimonas_sp.AAC.1